MKVGEYLSKMDSAPPTEELQEPNPTDLYINQLCNEANNQRIKEFNRVKIKEKYKINNDRFLENLKLL